jgi:hypothetical protein
MRFACSLVEDAGTELGYRVVDYDPAVADPTFTHGLHSHMRRAHPVNREATDDDGVVDVTTIAHPKDSGHFQEAVRSMPGARFRATGRPE